jgi:pimeloyl-ACP methyl ester carboxylesterase
MTNAQDVTLPFPDGGAVRATIAGSGPPVVLLHGWPQTRACWRQVVPPLAERYQVIAVDLPGLGFSPRPADYRKAAIAETVRCAVETVTGEQPLMLVGHDWGGIVAMFWAMDHPGSVRALAVVDVVTPLEFEGLPLLLPGGNPAWHFAFHGVPGLPELLVAGREAEYLHWWFGYRPGSRPSVTEEAAAEYAAAYASPGAMSSGFDYYRAVLDDVRDVTARAGSRLAMPVLAVGGQYGFGAAVKPSLERIAAVVEAVVIQGASHWVPDEKPAELTAALLQFFAGPAAVAKPVPAQKEVA